MDSIQQKELRNQVGEVLRRVEAGETLLITVAGRPVAELGPTRRRRWVSGQALRDVWDRPAPHGLRVDLDRWDTTIVDPFDR